MNVAGTRGDSLEDQTTVSLQAEEEQWLQRSPHSATQVERRTSILCEPTRMRLSEGRMSGMWPLGQQACGPVARIVPPGFWRAKLPGPPLTFAAFSLGEALKQFLPPEVGYWPPGQPGRDHPGSNISILTWSGGRGVIFWFVTSYWANFVT